MYNFKQYLQDELKLRPFTVEGHYNNVIRLLQWVVKSEINPLTIGYNDLLAYIQYEKQNGILPITINLRLGSITHYFEYLKQLGEVDKNPAKAIRVKGVVKRSLKTR